MGGQAFNSIQKDEYIRECEIEANEAKERRERGVDGEQGPVSRGMVLSSLV